MDREIRNSLWKKYVERAEFNEIEKRNLEMLGMDLQEDIRFLYQLIPLFKDKFVSKESQDTGVRFEYEENLYILRKGTIGIFLPEEKMKKTLIDMIDLFEEVLPLGTVVDLKKEHMRHQIDLSMVESCRIVITKRFVGVGKGIYYPYAGILYPMGTAGKGRVISFTASMIEKVVYKGFQDQLEKQFVGLMKQEIIINQGRKAAGFCTAEELQAAREEMEALAIDGRA